VVTVVIRLITPHRGLTCYRASEKMPRLQDLAIFRPSSGRRHSSSSLGFKQVRCWVALMLGDIGIAEVSVFLILAWISAAALIATVVLYRLHFRKAFAIAAYSGLISLALVVWAYFSIWGYVWAH
jgi:hypothetical protein